MQISCASIHEYSVNYSHAHHSWRRVQHELLCLSPGESSSTKSSKQTRQSFWPLPFQRVSVCLHLLAKRWRRAGPQRTPVCVTGTEPLRCLKEHFQGADCACLTFPQINSSHETERAIMKSFYSLAHSLPPVYSGSREDVSFNICLKRRYVSALPMALQCRWLSISVGLKTTANTESVNTDQFSPVQNPKHSDFLRSRYLSRHVVCTS